jgi:hypothetical protein
MLEMVLATDMGLHAKIYQCFRRRVTEEKEWVSREDQRLALSIAIKMSDISNCCRPSYLYREWAKNIAEEFYNQGDAEARLNLTVSPFMDRRRDKADFPKGQISFMNYIVIPLFEAAAMLLPKMQFTVDEAARNKQELLVMQQSSSCFAVTGIAQASPLASSSVANGSSNTSAGPSISASSQPHTTPTSLLSSQNTGAPSSQTNSYTPNATSNLSTTSGSHGPRTSPVASGHSSSGSSGTTSAPRSGGHMQNIPRPPPLIPPR